IESVVQSGTELLLYSVNNVTEGTDSQGEVTVRLSKAGRIVNGMGSDTDIVVASAKAYINALNKLAAKSQRVNPQYGEAVAAGVSLSRGGRASCKRTRGLHSHPHASRRRSRAAPRHGDVAHGRARLEPRRRGGGAAPGPRPRHEPHRHRRDVRRRRGR